MSSTVWWSSMWLSPLHYTSRSIKPWRAICSIVCPLKRHACIKLRNTRAIQVDAHFYFGFQGVAFYRCRALMFLKVSPNRKESIIKQSVKECTSRAVHACFTRTDHKPNEADWIDLEKIHNDTRARWAEVQPQQLRHFLDQDGWVLAGRQRPIIGVILAKKKTAQGIKLSQTGVRTITQRRGVMHQLLHFIRQWPRKPACAYHRPLPCALAERPC